MGKSAELKIKSKSLAAEAVFIRMEEQKLKERMKYKRERQIPTEINYATFSKLQSHRKHELRDHARATYLARAFGEGRSYKNVECNGYKGVNTTEFMKKVVAMVNKYYNVEPVTETTITTWMDQ